MSRIGSGRPFEAVSRASALVLKLRAALPGKAGRLLTGIDEIREAWTDCDLAQFPINGLVEHLDAIERDTKTESEVDQDVNRGSRVFDQVIEFDHRVRLSLEFMTANKVFESVQRQFRRIDDVLPVHNYALREVISHLDERYIPRTVRQRFEAGIGHFDREEYKLVLQTCGEAGEALLPVLWQHLASSGLGERPSQVGPALGRIRAFLGTPESKDLRGDFFRFSNRLEWLLLSLFETLHYLRNAVSHPPEAEQGPPLWQRERRTNSREEQDWARLALCVSLQIALELQAVLGHKAER